MRRKFMLEFYTLSILIQIFWGYSFNASEIETSMSEVFKTVQVFHSSDCLDPFVTEQSVHLTLHRFITQKVKTQQALVKTELK